MNYFWLEGHVVTWMRLDLNWTGNALLPVVTLLGVGSHHDSRLKQVHPDAVNTLTPIESYLNQALAQAGTLQGIYLQFGAYHLLGPHDTLDLYIIHIF